jgi:hypothetical protein
LVKICGRWEGFTLRTTFTGQGFTLRTTFTGEGFTLRTTFTGEGFTLRTTFTGEGFTLRTTFTGEGFTLRTADSLLTRDPNNCSREGPGILVRDLTKALVNYSRKSS